MLSDVDTQIMFQRGKDIAHKKRLKNDRHRYSQSSNPRASSFVKGRPMFSPDNTERSGPGAPSSGAAKPTYNETSKIHNRIQQLRAIVLGSHKTDGPNIPRFSLITPHKESIHNICKVRVLTDVGLACALRVKI